MTSKSVVARREPIEREDIEEKLREIQDRMRPVGETARTVGLATGVGIAAVAVLAAYWLGRRRGRRRQAVVEIRRI